MRESWGGGWRRAARAKMMAVTKTSAGQCRNAVHGERGSMSKITNIRLENFTAFARLDQPFSAGVNVIIGANGTGKTHLLKVLYSACAVTAGEGGPASSRKRRQRSTVRWLSFRPCIVKLELVR